MSREKQSPFSPQFVLFFPSIPISVCREKMKREPETGYFHCKVVLSKQTVSIMIIVNLLGVSGHLSVLMTKKGRLKSFAKKALADCSLGLVVQSQLFPSTLYVVNISLFRCSTLQTMASSCINYLSSLQLVLPVDKMLFTCCDHFFSSWSFVWWVVLEYDCFHTETSL